ncbi:MAG: DUF4965 domain-containing protein [Armatimonadetes bacterium]|nr:DUF4965 domain-containing protein [Armatimonadota bacterium]
MALPFETMLGRLGSRFALNFQPREKRILYSSLGKYFDKPLPLVISFALGGAERMLPWAEGQAFEVVEQDLTPTTVIFRCRSEPLSAQVEMRWVAPFLPRDVPTSIVPVYLLQVSWQPWTRAGTQAPAGPARLTIRFTGDGANLIGGAEPLRWRDTFSLWHPWYQESAGPPESINRRQFTGEFCMRAVAPASAQSSPDAISFDLPPGAMATLILAAHQSGDVLEILSQPHWFKYRSLWPDIETVVAYARDDLSGLLERSEFFDRVLQAASLGKSAQDLIAFSLQSYLQNTWWTVGADGREWFSCWEGNCCFHSTIDVEYNLAWFYLLLWPELLAMTMDEWALHEKFGAPEEKPVAVAYELEPGAAPPTKTSWLSHDMGALLTANGQAYPHEMELEENANFILLLHALAHFTGDESLFGRHWPMVERLCEYIIAADTTGNGVPNLGVANTIDDASAAVQYSREQVYLAFKCFCALHAAAATADRLGQTDAAERFREFAQRCEATLQEEAWLDDHFAVCLERSAEGLKDVWSGEPLTGELEGWDAYHIYSANGFLYLLSTGFAPPTSYDRLLMDISTATRAAMCEYGDFHSSADHSNLWVSQNLHRDLVAAYLGLDQLELAERYWCFEVYENTVGRGGAFVDTYGWNHLHYYPRGITSLGLMYALGGVRLSRLDRRLDISPVRVPCRVPLLSLADWKERRVPWLEARLEEGRVRVDVFGLGPEDKALLGRDQGA